MDKNIRELELGPKTRAYFRMMAGHDSAEDGPEVELIRAVRGLLLYRAVVHIPLLYSDGRAE